MEEKEEESPNFHQSHDHHHHHHHQHVPAESDHGLLRRPLRSIGENGLCFSYWSNNQDWSNSSSSSSISCHSRGGLNPMEYDRDREDEAADKLLLEFSFPKFEESLMSSSHAEGKEHGDDERMSVPGEKLMLRTLFVEKCKDRYDHEDSRDYSGIFGDVYPNMDLSNERRSMGVLLDCYEARAPAAFDFLGDKNSPSLSNEVREVVSEDSTFELIRGTHLSTGHGHHSALGIAAPPFACKKSSSDSKRTNYSSKAKVDRDFAPKKIKVEATPPWKVRKEKLGDKIAALQQLVAPFGKTDTASVLMEAIGYIKFLHNQVQTLCVPYMKSENVGPPSRGLRPRGLCLVPSSCMSLVTGDGAGGGGGFWPHVPYYGSS